MDIKELIGKIKDYVQENNLNELSITVKCKESKESGEDVFDIIVTNKITENV